MSLPKGWELDEVKDAYGSLGSEYVELDPAVGTVDAANAPPAAILAVLDANNLDPVRIAARELLKLDKPKDGCECPTCLANHALRQVLGVEP